VITELQDAERRTVDDVLTLQFCVNYGGRAEIVDATRRIAQLAAEGRLDPRKLTEERFRHFLDEPEIPDVDLFVRSSGEQRTSNFLLWQSAYAELVFLDRLWPDFDRRDLWRAIEQYAATALWRCCANGDDRDLSRPRLGCRSRPREPHQTRCRKVAREPQMMPRQRRFPACADLGSG
jgi:hypothetical protein